MSIKAAKDTSILLLIIDRMKVSQEAGSKANIGFENRAGRYIEFVQYIEIFFISDTI